MESKPLPAPERHAHDTQFAGPRGLLRTNPKPSAQTTLLPQARSRASPGRGAAIQPQNSSTLWNPNPSRPRASHPRHPNRRTEGASPPKPQIARPKPPCPQRRAAHRRAAVRRPTLRTAALYGIQTPPSPRASRPRRPNRRTEGAARRCAAASGLDSALPSFCTNAVPSRQLAIDQFAGYYSSTPKIIIGIFLKPAFPTEKNSRTAPIFYRKSCERQPGMNSEFPLSHKQPTRLKNTRCAYCNAEFLLPNEPQKEHVVGKNFVPRGSHDQQWNLHLNSCHACNQEKSALENDLSAITMIGGISEDISQDVDRASEALRKSKTVSRRSGKTVAESREELSIHGNIGAADLKVQMISPPQLDGQRAFRLAHYQLRGFFFMLTYDEEAERGYYWPGTFAPIDVAPRSDWGNELISSFSNSV